MCSFNIKYNSISRKSYNLQNLSIITNAKLQTIINNKTNIFYVKTKYINIKYKIIIKQLVYIPNNTFPTDPKLKTQNTLHFNYQQ